MPNQYIFLPWLRRGLAKGITDSDPLKAGAAAQPRASVPVSVRIMGDDAERGVVTQPVQLTDPGDITGINKAAIVKTEPAAGTQNFEPSFFPYVEFYEEDFLWRYTPAKAAGDRRLRPWIFLLILEEREFSRLAGRQAGANTAIEISAATAAGVLPAPEQIWAWAHVQVSEGSLHAGDLADKGSRDGKLAGILNSQPDLGVSRLLCPRKLRANTAYYAFLIPAFERGRLAGIGASKADIEAAGRFASSWGPAHTDHRYPVYHEWRFRTGNEDFEALAKKIVPRDLTGTDVGKLWMDAGDINYGSLFDYTGNLEPARPERQSFLPFEGALRLPGSGEPNLLLRPGAAERSFTERFAKLINLGVQYREQPKSSLQWSVSALGSEDDDPLLVPPVYGRWYVRPDGRTGVDPAQTGRWPEQLNLDPALRVAAGLGAEVIREHQEEYMSRAWEQLADNRRRLNAELLRLRFAQEVSKAAFSKHFSPQAATPEGSSRILALTQPLHALVKTDVAGQSISGALHTAKTDAAFVQPAYRRVTRIAGPVMKRIRTVDAQNIRGKAILNGNISFDAITLLLNLAPPFQNFSAEALAAVKPESYPFEFRDAAGKEFAIYEHANWLGASPGKFGIERAVLLAAIKALFEKTLRKPLILPKPVLNMQALSMKVMARIQPAVSFGLRFQSKIPQNAAPAIAGSGIIAPNTFNPSFGDATYERLSRLHPELFIPNLEKIQPDSFVLLQANSAFIESYLVGMNHELASEFLWRGFPADQHATFFRKFWDKSDSAAAAGGEGDIQPIRLWPAGNPIGGNQPPGTGNLANPLVFVIKAELVRKYPNLVVYAHKAKFNPNGTRQPLESAQPLLPLFMAGMGPDFLFAGFNLRKEDVLDTGGRPQIPGGWYFVIAERPGEMHFGLDQSRPAGKPMLSWNDLAWTDLPADISTLDLTKHIPAKPAPNDGGLIWGKGESSPTPDPAAGAGDAAHMAAILQQRPVRIYIHASLLVR